MKELLTTMSPTQVALVIFLCGIALKEVLELIDFFRNRLKKRFNKETEEESTQDKILQKLNALEEKGIERDAQIASILATTNLLIESDKDDIRGWIVAQYHYFSEKEWVDDFSMDVLEKRFAHYQEEGGNSYIETLMKQLRKLPRSPKQK